MINNNLLIILVFSVFLIGFFGDFITTIIWWKRIHPWFSYGEDEGKTVYQCLNTCWILSLIGMIITAFLFVLFLLLKSNSECILKKKIIFIFVFIFVVDCISIAAIIFGIKGSTYALRNPSEKGNEEQKCAKYKWKGYLGATVWVYQHKEKFNEYSIFFEKLFNNHSEGYLCRDVGAPTLAFALIQCCGIALSILFIILTLIDFFKQKKGKSILNDFEEV